MSHQPFLQHLASHLATEHQGDLSHCCIILPNRRSQLYLDHHLRQAGVTEEDHRPEITSLGDFIAESLKKRHPQPVKIGDPLELIFILYQLYRKHMPRESFEQFYPWGRMLLNDFNDIDKNLADARQLLTNVEDARELDEWEPGARDFWKELEGQEAKPVQREFYRIWEMVCSLYSEFQQVLQEKEMTTEGMAFRMVAEQARQGNFQPHCPLLVFAGFNALPRAAEKLIFSLRSRGAAELYVDADRHYLDHPKHEAGLYMRRMRRQIGADNLHWKEDLLEKDEKDVHMVGVPLSVGQTKAVAAKLQELAQEHPDWNWEKTVVVLPDENMLLPVLNALPSEVPQFNVTMGYPFRFTALYQLISNAVRLHLERKVQDGQVTFYFRHVISLLKHPFIQELYGEAADQMAETLLSRQQVYITAKQIGKDFPDMNPLLLPLKTVPEAIHFLLHLVGQIESRHKEKDRDGVTVDDHFFQHFRHLLEQLEHMVGTYDHGMKLDAFLRLMEEVIQGARVPFSGEPLEGLQVMGMLETRALDFDHVFILSVNEKVLPRESNRGSFIPYDLRKAFGLPTVENQGALYSYNFYRLLQRAKTVHLFYNTQPKHFGAGEKSRFLLQVEHLLAPKNPNLHLHKQLVNAPVDISWDNTIRCNKSPETLEKLEQIATGKGFSASALCTWSICSLQYYFRYIAGIPEEKELAETIEANVFGTIYHNTMENLYRERLNRALQASDFEEMQAEIEEAIEQAVKDTSKKEKLPLDQLSSGKNYFLMAAIKMLVAETLRLDASKESFTMREVEKRVEPVMEMTLPHKPNKPVPVQLQGVIDRISETADGVEIVDYKTGLVEQVKYNLSEPVPAVSKGSHKPPFQLMFYSWLYSNVKVGKTPVKAGIISTKALNKGIMYLTVEKQKEVIQQDEINLFGMQLKNLLHQMFDPKEPIAQTDVLENCTYCPYNRICMRH